MKHLDEIERFVNLVEKVTNLYEIPSMEVHDYVLSYLKGNVQIDKKQLEERKEKESTPKSHEELAEYIASHIRISSEDMLTLIEGIENGYNLNENLLYAIADRDKTIKSLKSAIQDKSSIRSALPSSCFYGDLTFKEFGDHLSSIGLSLCWDVNREMLSIGKREFANSMLWFDPRVEERDYNGSVQFKSINTSLFSERQVYDAIRLVDSLLMTDSEKRGVPPKSTEHYSNPASQQSSTASGSVGATESPHSKEGLYKKALETIASETSCDDTWDYANRVLNGEGDSELPYRMNSE